MNNLRNYFSPTKNEQPTSSSAACTPTSKNNIKSAPKSSGNIDKRQIVSNMESVINSVKKKHRHRKKRSELNKSEPEIIDISNTLSNSLSFISPDATLETVQTPSSALKENILEVGNSTTKTRKRRSQKATVKEKSRPTSPIPETSKKSLSAEDKIDNSMKGLIKPKPKETTANESEGATPKLNAFTLMMNARNRVIGSNGQGKESSKEDDVTGEDPKKAKRKLLLEEWAARKGGTKRKLEEVEREEYIEKQMEKRAKRLKKMLVNNKKSPKSKKISENDVKVATVATKENTATTSVINDERIDDVPAEEVVALTTIKKRGRPRKIIKPTEDLPSAKLNTPPPIATGQKTSSVRVQKRARRISSTESEKILEIVPDENFLNDISLPLKKRTTPKESASVNETQSKSDRKRQRKRCDPSTIESDQINDSDFLDNLSSPIKKRDSLLGYFPKLKSPDDNEKTESTPTKTEPTTRPRRSCVGKVRYDEEIYELSPPKSEQNRSRRRKSSVETKSQNNSDTDIICLDVTDDSTATSQKPTKLAPLFVKTVPKPAIDPAVLQAKKDFLMSGIPEKMLNEMAKQQQFEETYAISMETMFPKVSHVGREEDTDEKADILWERHGIRWQEDRESPKKRIIETKIPLTPQKGQLPELQKLKNLENKVDIIKGLKVVYDKFPTYRCYKQLREKYKLRKGIAVEQVADSFVVMNMQKQQKSNRDETDDCGTNGELMFIDKYKPMNSEQVLVNFQPVNQLREFLSNWQQNGRANRLNDSLNDFECSNDSSMMDMCNSIVLHGPSSSGKTNAVFALANEMNFNVLEINAGMKRTGKKLLQELQEATQSHQVRNDKSNLLKRSFSFRKSQEPNTSDSSSQTDLSGTAKLSLILVEDADIVFEQDSGFIEAINQLVATSKRPVIIVSNSSECPHLGRLQRQSAIEFLMPNALNISKFLSVLSLVENCPIDLDDIIRLYMYNKRNLRRTLLEMQFFIHSGGDRVRHDVLKVPAINGSVARKKLSTDEDTLSSKDANGIKAENSNDVYTHQTLFKFYTTNQNADHFIPYPIDFDCLHSNLRGFFAANEEKPAENAKSAETKSNSLESIAQFYDNISIASYITSREVEDRLCENLEETIAHSLAERTTQLTTKSKPKVDLVPKRLPERTLLSTYLPLNNIRANLSIDLDYEPTLRSICRSEMTRSKAERRSSRFYHYLRNICANTDSFSTLEFDKQCSILSQDVCEESNN